MDNNTHKTENGTVELYRDDAGQWRWRIKAKNRQVTAGPQQGYKTRRGALKGLAATVRVFAAERVVQRMVNGLGG